MANFDWPKHRTPLCYDTDKKNTAIHVPGSQVQSVASSVILQVAGCLPDLAHGGYWNFEFRVVW
jgi:hypothetical protein